MENIMNYIEIGILALTGVAILFGLILGIARGSRRAILRLILVLLCIVAAYFLKDPVTNIALNEEVPESIAGTSETGEAVTVQQFIVNQLPEDVRSLGETVVVPLVKVIAGTAMFLLLFLALQFLSWLIIYPICKIFVKKAKKKRNKDGEVVYGKKHGGIGAIFGLIQGVAVALCLCITLTGLAIQADRVVAMVDDLSSATQASASVDSMEFAFADEDVGGVSTDSSTSESTSIIPPEIEQMLKDYENTTVGKFYGETCSPAFTYISSVKISNEDGTTQTITLGGQVDALQTMVDIVVEVQKSSATLQGIDFSNLSSLSDLQDVFAAIDNIKDGLSDEAKATVNAVISSAIDMIPVPEEAQGFLGGVKDVLKETDFTEISFSNELTIISSVSEKLEDVSSITTDDVAEMINTISESQLIVPVLGSMDVDLNLSDSEKDQLNAAFDQLPEDTNEETVEVLKNLLGLTTSTDVTIDPGVSEEPVVPAE